MFKDFGRRLQRDVKHIVDGRIANSETASGSHMRVSSARYLRFPSPELIYITRLSRAESKSTSSPTNVNVSQYGTEEV